MNNVANSLCEIVVSRAYIETNAAKPKLISKLSTSFELPSFLFLICHSVNPKGPKALAIPSLLTKGGTAPSTFTQQIRQSFLNICKFGLQFPNLKREKLLPKRPEACELAIQLRDPDSVSRRLDPRRRRANFRSAPRFGSLWRWASDASPLAAGSPGCTEFTTPACS